MWFTLGMDNDAMTWNHLDADNEALQRAEDAGYYDGLSDWGRHSASIPEGRYLDAYDRGYRRGEDAR